MLDNYFIVGHKILYNLQEL